MTRSILLLAAAAVACSHPQHIGGGGGGGGGGDSGGGAGPIPADVRKTVEATLGPNARISVEREGGALVYEAVVDTKLEIELDAKGQLKTTEVEIPLGALPSAVVATAKTKGTITEAEVVITPAGVAFQIEVGNTEYTIDASGAILSSEQEADEPGDDED
jgi:hypothetical protein